jgi:hypothetical protein
MMMALSFGAAARLHVKFVEYELWTGNADAICRASVMK